MDDKFYEMRGKIVLVCKTPVTHSAEKLGWYCTQGSHKISEISGEYGAYVPLLFVVTCASSFLC